MKNLKFSNLKLDSIDKLSIEEMKCMKGGYGTNPSSGTVCAYTCTTLLGNQRTIYGPPGTTSCAWYESTTPGPCASW